MTTVGVRELKNRLSRYLEIVKRGEDLTVTERGKPIARITSAEKPPRSLDDRLAMLAGQGVLRLPTRSRSRRKYAPLRCGGIPLSGMVIEDRR